jgi:hypothetical protein
MYVYRPENNSHLFGTRVVIVVVVFVVIVVEPASIWMAMRFFDLTQKSL